MAEDYIMRLARQVAEMLAAIIVKRREGKPEEVRQELDSTCLETIGLPLSVVKRMTPDAVAKLLEQSGGNRYMRSVLLAELLMQDAEILEEDREVNSALGARLHAFCLLFDSFPNLSDEEQALYQPKLDWLAMKLEHLPPNPFVTHKLRAYHESRPSVADGD